MIWLLLIPAGIVGVLMIGGMSAASRLSSMISRYQDSKGVLWDVVNLSNATRPLFYAITVKPSGYGVQHATKSVPTKQEAAALAEKFAAANKRVA